MVTTPRELGLLLRRDMVVATLRDPSDEFVKRVTRRKTPRWARIPVGTRLWVRETWSVATGNAYDGRAAVRYVADGAVRAFEGQEGSNKLARNLTLTAWRSSMVMPRWASRILLEVEDITEEPGQSPLGPLPLVTDAEARLEGVADRAAYLRLWADINGNAPPPDRLYRIAFKLVEVKRG